MIEVNIIKVDRRVVAVTYRDRHGMFQGRVVSVDAVTRTDNNRAMVRMEDLENAMEYGFDWTIALDDVQITAHELQQSLRAHGIWQLEDLLQKPNEGVAAFLAVAKASYALLVRRARDCIVD